MCKDYLYILPSSRESLHVERRSEQTARLIPPHNRGPVQAHPHFRTWDNLPLYRQRKRITTKRATAKLASCHDDCEALERFALLGADALDAAWEDARNDQILWMVPGGWGARDAPSRG